MLKFKNKNLVGTLELLLAAFIWGSAFVAQSEGMNHVGPFTFQTVRFFIGGLVLLPVIFIKDRLTKGSLVYAPPKSDNKKLFSAGIICGILLTVAAAFQQVGIVYTTPGKAGFITTLYVIFVPVFGLLFGKKTSVNVWISILIATVGLYLLCMSESLALSLGDALVLCSAFGYTAQIMAVDKYSPSLDPIKLSCIQFFTVALISAIPMFIFEAPDTYSILKVWFPIIYTGVFSSGVAFTLQIVAQRHTESTIAAITMSFESVFAILTECVVLISFPTFKEGLGCVIMFCAIILAQLPPIKTKR